MTRNPAGDIGGEEVWSSMCLSPSREVLGMKPKYIVGIVGLVQNDIRPLPAPPPVHSSHNVTAASARMLLLRARAGLHSHGFSVESEGGTFSHMGLAVRARAGLSQQPQQTKENLVEY